MAAIEDEFVDDMQLAGGAEVVADDDNIDEAPGEVADVTDSAGFEQESGV